jgi:gliding motility-associated-like protein
MQEPAVLKTSVTILEQNKCSGVNKVGKIQGSAIGGTPLYTYYLKPTLDFSADGYFSNLGAANYTITVKDVNGCTSYQELEVINVSPPIELKTTITDVTCNSRGNDGKIVIAPQTGEAPFAYVWSAPGMETIITSQNYIDNLKFGTYQLTVTDNLGCYITQAVVIDPPKCCDVWMPTAFSPGNDQENNTYKLVTGADLEVIKLAMYDRWGNKVYETFDLNQGWDGKYKGQDMAMDTYFVIFTYRCKFDNLTYTKRVDVTLVR